MNADEFARTLSLLPQLRQKTLHHLPPALLRVALPHLAHSSAPLLQELDVSPKFDRDVREADWRDALGNSASLTFLRLDASNLPQHFLVSAPAPISAHLLEFQLFDPFTSTEPFPLHTLFPCLTRLT